MHPTKIPKMDRTQGSSACKLQINNTTSTHASFAQGYPRRGRPPRVHKRNQICHLQIIQFSVHVSHRHDWSHNVAADIRHQCGKCSCLQERQQLVWMLGNMQIIAMPDTASSHVSSQSATHGQDRASKLTALGRTNSFTNRLQKATSLPIPMVSREAARCVTNMEFCSTFKTGPSSSEERFMANT